MIDHFTSSDESEIDALANAVDAVCGYPCCGCNDKPVDDCPCTRHVYANGSPAPHQGSCTLRYAEKIKHPERDEWAYPVDDVVRACAVAPDTKPPAGGKTIGVATVDPRALIADAVARAVERTAEWQPVPDLVAAQTADVAAGAQVVDAKVENK